MSDFENEMRALEIYHNIKIPHDKWIILRVDGRSFSSFTEKYFDKPVDIDFQQVMLSTTELLVQKTDALFGYVESDEISLLLPRDTNWFDRELEKLVSVSSGLASTIFYKNLINNDIVEDDYDFPHFDSRVIQCDNPSVVVDYFLWRRSDARRCALNGLLYWTLVNSGQTKRKTASFMEAMKRDTKIEELKKLGINWEDIDYQDGSAVVWESYLKEGYNPKLNKVEYAVRKRTSQMEKLPKEDAYPELLYAIMEEYEERNDLYEEASTSYQTV